MGWKHTEMITRESANSCPIDRKFRENDVLGDVVCFSDSAAYVSSGLIAAGDEDYSVMKRRRTTD
jgi:hypothetical protein